MKNKYPFILRYISFLLLFLLAFDNVLLSINTVASGNWSAGATWSGGSAPSSSTDVTVNSTHSITLNQNLSISNSAVCVFSGSVTDAAGGTAYTATLQNTCSLTVQANFTIEGKLTVKNSAALIVNGAAGTTVTCGSLDVENNCTVYIAPGCTLVVNGAFNQKNESAITLDGTMLISGAAELRNTASIIPTTGITSGYFRSLGTTSFSGSASLFGSSSGCSTPPCVFLPPGSPLPIDLSSFTAVKQDNNVLIKWITATEINNDYFNIERSKNGASFESIGKINGSGNSSTKKEYSFVDEKPLTGTSYYRLKQTDYDGKNETFQMISIYYESLPGGACIFKVFPNPCFGQCSVALEECDESEKAEIAVEVMDAAGNKVYSKVPLRDDKGMFSFQIDTENNLKPGIYIVHSGNKKESYSQKLIIK